MAMNYFHGSTLLNYSELFNCTHLIFIDFSNFRFSLKDWIELETKINLNQTMILIFLIF